MSLGQIIYVPAQECLRDTIAISAMNAILNRFGKDPSRERMNESDEKCVSEQAYKYADAMLEARKKNVL